MRSPSNRGLGRYERVRLINLRLCRNARLLQMRSELLAEASRCFFRFPDVNHSKAVRAFSGSVDQESFDRPIRSRLRAILPHHAANDLVVTLPRHVWPLMNKHDRHARTYPSAGTAQLYRRAAVREGWTRRRPW